MKVKFKQPFCILKVLARVPLVLNRATSGAKSPVAHKASVEKCMFGSGTRGSTLVIQYDGLNLTFLHIGVVAQW